MIGDNTPDSNCHLPSEEEIARLKAELCQKHMAEMRNNTAPTRSPAGPRTTGLLGLRRRYLNDI